MYSTQVLGIHQIRVYNQFIRWVIRIYLNGKLIPGREKIPSPDIHPVSHNHLETDRL